MLFIKEDLKASSKVKEMAQRLKTCFPFAVFLALNNKWRFGI